MCHLARKGFSNSTSETTAQLQELKLQHLKNLFVAYKVLALLNMFKHYYITYRCGPLKPNMLIQSTAHCGTNKSARKIGVIRFSTFLIF